MSKCDILIIGAGVPGLSLAVLLGATGLEVTLADAGPAIPAYDPAKPDGRTVALMGASVDILARAGIEDAIRADGNPLKRMAVVDDSRYPAGADNMIEQIFDSAETGRDAFGWNIPLPALRAALHTQIKKYKNIAFMPGTSLSDLKTLKYDLLVGADGRNSAVRTQAGIDAFKKSYGQTAITCVIEHSSSHRNTSTEFHRPGGPFTLVPMRGKTSAIVWVEKDADAEAFLKLPRDGFTRGLQERTRDMVGSVRLVTNPVSWPLECLRSEKLAAPRTVLVAEAAHVMSPIGAQGLNLSLRDIRDLADTILNARHAGLDIGSDTVLADYARRRSGDISSRTTAIDFTNQMVASNSGPLRALRRLALRAMSLPGPLRQMIMKKGLAA